MGRCCEPIGKLGLDGRDYHVGDMPTLISLGASAGYLAVLLLALYVNSLDINVMYSRPKVVRMLCPILLCWSSRIWIKSVKGKKHHDPLTLTFEVSYTSTSPPEFVML